MHKSITKYEVKIILEQMKIAVCDDVKDDRDKLKNDLADVWVDAAIDTYESGYDVLRQVQKGMNYDLIFMDIIMKQGDGIEAGREILRYFPETEIVYISTSREFGPEAFELDALHYIIKPYEPKVLREVKRRYVRMKEKKAVVHLKKDQQQEIPFHMIAYIESAHNNLLIHLITGATLKIRGSIQSFMEALDERFLRINRGIVVNMEAIDKMKTDSCEVAGVTFMLSRKERAENKKKYNDWLFKNAMGGWNSSQ